MARKKHWQYPIKSYQLMHDHANFIPMMLPDTIYESPCMVSHP